jgi:tetratricopeptide (TPR) repeat protein
VDKTRQRPGPVAAPGPAIWAYERALKLDPRYWHAVYNYAVLLLRTGRFEEALISFNLCDQLQPNHAATLNRRGEALHNLNRFEEALSVSKHAQALDPTNADICNSIAAALWKLTRHEEALEWFDRSLNQQPDFVAAQDRRQIWEGRLGRHDRLRVGLVWSGNPKHKNDRNRSIPLAVFSSVLDADATFVSLQKDPNSADKAILFARTDIVDLTAHLSDFMETAALISCLDLVVTVDTAVAHLASALGRTTWILLPYNPDYRWLLGREDSPWYPTARLFPREWSSVLDRARTELMALIEDRKHNCDDGMGIGEVRH